LTAVWLVLALVTAGTAGLRGAEKPEEKERESGKAPVSKAWVLDTGGIRIELTEVALFQERLGFFNLTNVPVRDFQFRIGKAELKVPLRIIKVLALDHKEGSVRITSFFEETIEARIDTEVKFTLEGKYNFGKFSIELDQVRQIEFEAPFVQLMYCEIRKGFFAQPGWKFCPIHGVKLKAHSWMRVGSGLGKGEKEGSGDPWKGWHAEVESGIRAHVTDRRNRKIEIHDAQLFRERLGLLSLTVEPTDTYVLKIGQGTINVEVKKIKNLQIDQKVVHLTDFEEKRFKADVAKSERFFLKGRYKFARISIALADLQSITFLPPPGAFQRCDSCQRLFSQETWTHCPYDGAPLK
jgi:hypothetical protein